LSNLHRFQVIAVFYETGSDVSTISDTRWRRMTSIFRILKDRPPFPIRVQ